MKGEARECTSCGRRGAMVHCGLRLHAPYTRDLSFRPAHAAWDACPPPPLLATGDVASAKEGRGRRMALRGLGSAGCPALPVDKRNAASCVPACRFTAA